MLFVTLARDVWVHSTYISPFTHFLFQFGLSIQCREFRKINNFYFLTGEMEFKCDCCDMAFNKKSALEIHSRVHTGVRPYRCNICTKAFSIHGNLKRHLLIHTDERPYVCSTCSSSFNNPSHLTRHIKNKHRISNSAPSDNKGLVHSTRPAP